MLTMIIVIRRALRQLFLLVLLVLLVVIVIKAAPFVVRQIYPLRYQEIITQQADSLDVDPSLIAAIINVESHWRADAISPKGARGLMQLMPATADWAAEKTGNAGITSSQLLQPELNIELGTWYIADLLRQFDNSLVVALAAYNGGRGNVRNWLDAGIWNGSIQDIDRIPFGETKRYVQKVIRHYEVYKSLYDWTARP